MSSPTSQAPAEAAPNGMPAAARMAIVLVAAFGLACLAIAVEQRGSWDDLAVFLCLGLLAANLARDLARRERWAWQACCWIALITLVSFGPIGTGLGVLLVGDLAGWEHGFFTATPQKAAFWAVWMLLMVVIPGTVGYALTRPPVRAWFSADPAG